MSGSVKPCVNTLVSHLTKRTDHMARVNELRTETEIGIITPVGMQIEFSDAENIRAPRT